MTDSHATGESREGEGGGHQDADQILVNLLLALAAVRGQPPMEIKVERATNELYAVQMLWPNAAEDERYFLKVAGAGDYEGT